MRLLFVAAALMSTQSVSAQGPEQAVGAVPYAACSRRVVDRCIQLGDAPEEEPSAAAFENETGVGGPFEPIEDPVQDHADAAPVDSAGPQDPAPTPTPG